MHPKDVSPFLIAEYGYPDIKKTFGLAFAHFKPGQIPGWKIAKRLHLAGLLSDVARKAAVTNVPATPAEWEKIAALEKIPSAGYTPPFITDFIDALPRKARMSEITYDTDFTTTLFKVLESFALNTPGKSTIYPLLDGPPGASKSIVVYVAAALLGLPVYTVTGSDGAADEIKIALLGGDNACADTLHGLIRRYAYQGWIKNPLSQKLLAIGLHEHGTIDALPNELLEAIAGHEKIRENITCFTPGAYQLAALNGGILFLDEVNGFKGVTTVLTEILENYTVDQHPNLFIIGALNPSGEKHDRDPLPPEIRSRTTTVYVKAPSVSSYQNMLQYLFSGKQPQITLPSGRVGQVTPLMTGFSVPPRTPSLLQKSLQPDSFSALMNNLANFHKHIETKYEEGVLNPKDTAVPSTNETTSVDRRMLVRAINSLDTYLHLLQDPSAADLSSGVIPYSEYKSIDETPSRELICRAIERMLERIYLDNFNFPMKEELKMADNKKLTFNNAQELVRHLIEFSNLSYDKLSKYIKTQEDVEKILSSWSKVLSSRFSITDKAHVRSIVEESIKEDITPTNKYYSIVRTKDKPQFTHVNYMATKSARQSYLQTNYPGVSLVDSEATPLLTAIENRTKSFSGKSAKQRLVTVDELKDSPELSAFVQQLREEHQDKIFIIPFPEGDSLGCAFALPLSCLNKEVANNMRKKMAEKSGSGSVQSFISRKVQLREAGAPNSTHKLLTVLNNVFQPLNGSDRIVVDHITEVVVLDFLVSV